MGHILEHGVGPHRKNEGRKRGQSLDLKDQNRQGSQGGRRSLGMF